MSTARERYDEVPYLTKAYSDTNPDRLATIARLVGLRTAALPTARVLEVGCGTGGNLFPLAALYPEAEVIGFDLSPVQIEMGRSWAASMGLANLDLRVLDILDASVESLGTFDYIVVHGVYAWVPPAVQAALLDLVAAVLRPEGVAFISWNAYPGWHLRGGIRQVMQFGARAGRSPLEQVRAGQQMLALTAQLAAPDSAWRATLERESTALADMPSSYLFHDFLADVNRPLLLDTFQSELDPRGLQYLGEAAWTEWFDDRFTDVARASLQQLGGDFVRQQQVRDVIRNRGFHEALVVQATAEPDRRVAPERLAGMHAAGLLRPTGEVDLRDGVEVAFTTLLGAEFSVSVPLLKAMLVELAACCPATIAIDELAQRAHALLGTQPAEVEASAEADTARIRSNLLQAYGNGLVDLHTTPMRCAPVPSERSRAFGPARVLAAANTEWVANMRHESVSPRDLDRHILVLLDGTRDVAGLVDALIEGASRGDFQLTDGDDRPIADLAATRAQLASYLKGRLLDYGRLGLLES